MMNYYQTGNDDWHHAALQYNHYLGELRLFVDLKVRLIYYHLLFMYTY